MIKKITTRSSSNDKKHPWFHLWNEETKTLLYIQAHEWNKEGFDINGVNKPSKDFGTGWGIYMNVSLNELDERIATAFLSPDFNSQGRGGCCFSCGQSKPEKEGKQLYSTLEEFISYKERTWVVEVEDYELNNK